GPPARRPPSLQLVEEGVPCLRLPTLPVEAEREPVCLVPDALEQLEPGGVARENDRLRTARHEYLLRPLRERDHGHSWKVVGLHRRQCRRELALAAVDHHE